MNAHHSCGKPEQVFVFGHQNPDLDSAVSAVIAAQLKKDLNPTRDYYPLLMGEPNRQTKWLFAEAGVPIPLIRDDLRYSVGELMKTEPHAVAASDHLGQAMDLMQKYQISLVPVVDDKKRLLGVLSDRLPQNQYFFNFNVEDFLGTLLHLDDLVRALSLEPANGAPPNHSVAAGRLVLFSHDAVSTEQHITPSDIVILGPYSKAIENMPPAKALIIADASEEFCASIAATRPAQPIYRYRGSLLALASQLPRAIAVNHVMCAKAASLRPDQLVSDVIDEVVATPHALPVIDQEGKLVGIFSRRDALGQKPRQVILVDHCERSQSIRGFDLAEIVEIIDHHRIGDVQTVSPLRIDCRPIGSTASILALQFREAGKTPSQSQARLLLGALISDTLLLTSPTSTPIDREIALWLSELAQVSLHPWGQDVLAQNDELADGDPEKLVMKDCKEFVHGDCRFRGAQIETVSLGLLTDNRRMQLQEACDRVRSSSGASLLVLMVTDVFRGDSRLLISDSNLKRAQHLLQVENPAEGKEAPGWVSRKKQLLPYLLGQLNTWKG